MGFMAHSRRQPRPNWATGRPYLDDRWFLQETDRSIDRTSPRLASCVRCSVIVSCPRLLSPYRVSSSTSHLSCPLDSLSPSTASLLPALPIERLWGDRPNVQQVRPASGGDRGRRYQARRDGRRCSWCLLLGFFR